MARTKSALVHTDAVQSAGKLPLNVQKLGVDYLSISGHKLGALAGTGVLFVRKGSPLETLWPGDHHEKGRRAGTENVVGIVALGAACRAIRETGIAENRTIEQLRNRLEIELLRQIPDCSVTGAGEPRLPNTAHLTFEGVDGESLLIAADLAGIDCSTGAACASGSLKPSPVLLAMGFTPEAAHSSLRFSLGWSTTEADIERAIDILPKLVAQVRRVGQNIQPRLGS
jgi:cysteine desulfurase